MGSNKKRICPGIATPGHSNENSKAIVWAFAIGRSAPISSTPDGMI